MCVYRGVPRSTSQTLALSEGDVLVGARIPKPLGEAEVNDPDEIGRSAPPREKVVGLHVSVQEILRVHEFYAMDHLVCDHEHCFHTKSLPAGLKELLQTWAQQIYDKSVVILLHSAPVDCGDACSSLEYSIDFGLIYKLWMSRAQRFELDGDLLLGLGVCAKVYFAETATPDLLSENVLASHAEFHLNYGCLGVIWYNLWCFWPFLMKSDMNLLF